MKISVVIPAYNEEKIIATAIKSVLDQDYRDFEIIVVNNASTDGTFELAGKFEGVRVVNEPKKGLPAARERGRIEATGEIVANMDADCLPEKNWLSRGAALFNNPKVVAASGPYDYYDAGKWIRNFYLWYQKHIQSLSIMNAIFGRGLKGGWIAGGNAFIRTSALERLGGYDTSVEFWGEDVITAKILSKAGTVIFDKNLVMKTSGRRFSGPNNGFFKTSFRYMLCTLKTISFR